MHLSAAYRLPAPLRCGRKLVLALAPVFLLACAEDPDDALADDDIEAKRALHGWVVVERGEADGAVRSNVSAKFLQVADGDVAIAQRLVGARPDVPASSECAPLKTFEEATLVSPSFAVDLIDVGDVTLAIQEPDAALTRVSLAPRAFPDIGDVVSGVFYTSPDAAIGLPVPADYEIGSSGSSLVDAFVIDARAPSAPRNVAIDHVSADATDAAEPTVIAVRAGRDIEITWASEAHDGSNLVYVDVRAEAHDGRPGSAHRCTFPDGGAAVLPAGLLSASDDTAMLTLHRLTERAAMMRGAEDAHPATVVFDLSKTVRLVVR